MVSRYSEILEKLKLGITILAPVFKLAIVVAVSLGTVWWLLCFFLGWGSSLRLSLPLQTLLVVAFWTCVLGAAIILPVVCCKLLKLDVERTKRKSEQVSINEYLSLRHIKHEEERRKDATK